MAATDPIGIAGRQVVITGGAGALGDQVVAQLQRAGAVCHVPVRGNAPPAKGKGLPGVRYVTGVDLTVESSVVELYEGLPGRLWASVHLAGGFTMGPLVDTSLPDLRGQLDLNLVTAFLCSREAIRAIRRADRAALPSGGGGAAAVEGRAAISGGRIVHVASRSGLRPEANQLAYSVSKAAIVALTAGLADEVKGDGILVNAVAPGTMDTPANRRSMPDVLPQNLVATADVAALIVWLASPANTAGSGATIPIYGNS